MFTKLLIILFVLLYVAVNNLFVTRIKEETEKIDWAYKETGKIKEYINFLQGIYMATLLILLIAMVL